MSASVNSVIPCLMAKRTAMFGHGRHSGVHGVYSQTTLKHWMGGIVAEAGMMNCNKLCLIGLI